MTADQCLSKHLQYMDCWLHSACIKQLSFDLGITSMAIIPSFIVAHGKLNSPVYCIFHGQKFLLSLQLQPCQSQASIVVKN